jgi:membrane protein DedA with SNARE-associated domain
VFDGGMWTSDAVAVLTQDISWTAQFFSLLVLPFAHEDLAILLGGYMVVHKIMPGALVALCIYGGMVASDLALYGIGAGARRLPWLTRLAVSDRVHAFGEMLKRNLFGWVALCRVVPGAVFVAFVACGWTRMPLARFAVASLVVSALYLPLMLCIVVFFGDALDDRAGFWTWPLLLCVLVAIGFVRRQVFAFQEGSGATAVRTTTARSSEMLAAMADRARTLAPVDRIPLGLFYLPLMISWIAFALRYRSLTLPTLANPLGWKSGAWSDSTSDYLLAAATGERQRIADFVTLTRSSEPRTLHRDLEQARRSLSTAGLAFPLVARFDVGPQRADTVADMSELREYIRNVAGDRTIILHRFEPEAGEATVLYARLPGSPSGRLLSVTIRRAPHVIGGGAQDGRRYLTAELEAQIDAVALGMREFYFGRFDVRFPSTVALMRGESLSVVGISGIGGEASDVRDPALSLIEAYRRLIEQQRIMFLIGDRNRARGFVPGSLADVVRSVAGLDHLPGRRRPTTA